MKTAGQFLKSRVLGVERGMLCQCVRHPLDAVQVGLKDNAKRSSSGLIFWRILLPELLEEAHGVVEKLMGMLWDCQR
jgi:hypothetical protein